MKVVGLDLSLTGTGIAVVRSGTQGGAPILHEVITDRWETKAAGDLVADRADRLTNLAGRVVEVCAGADIVLIERMAYSSNTGSVTDRAGLWWLVCARLCRGLHIPVVDVVNNHLKMYATGVGNAGKDRVLAEVVRRFGHLVPELATNDEADAFTLAAMGHHRLTGSPLVDLPQTHHRALTAVKWPTLNR